MKKLLLFFWVIITLSSCAFHTGTVSTDLAPENVYYESIASGYSQTTHVFGIGGLQRKTLIQDAKKDLYYKNPLKPGQRYLNMVVDIKTTLVLCVAVVNCNVTADIISVKENAESVFSDNYFGVVTSENLAGPFQKGDTILTAKGERMILHSFKNNKKAYFTNLENPTDSTYLKNPVEIFSIVGKYRSYKIGQYLIKAGVRYQVINLYEEKARVFNLGNGLSSLETYKTLDLWYSKADN